MLGRSVNDTDNNLGEVRDILIELEADEEIGNLEEEEVAIIEEKVAVLERRQRDKLPALRDTPKKKLLVETTKVDKVLCKFKTHRITKTNELFCAAVVVTDRLGVKIREKKITRQQRKRNQCGEGGYKIRLKSQGRT